MNSRFILLLLMLVVVSHSSFGDVAPPYPYLLSQPDGLMFEARMFGDEYHSWVETLDGRIILDVLDDDNNIWWYYATVDSEGFYAPSQILVGADTSVDLPGPLRSEDAPQRAAAPLRGKFRRIADMDRQSRSMRLASPLAASGVCKPVVFLVDFPGTLPNQTPSHKYTKEQFAKLLFAEKLNPNSTVPALPGTYEMSVRDYYAEISGGEFLISGSTASIVDWTRTENAYRYYVDEMQGNGFGPNGWTHSAAAACVELAQKVDYRVDYANFDGNQDGVVDFVILIMEGWTDGSKHYFWSFQSILSDVADIDPDAPTDDNGFLLLDGVTIKKFIVTTEQAYALDDDGRAITYLDFSHGDIRPIGTFCHEIGHVLGLPDLYDTDSLYDPDKGETTWSAGIGVWGLMGAGNYNRETCPSYMCAWSRSRLNWIATETCATGLMPMRLSVPPAEDDHVAFKIPIRPYDSSECFLLENRRSIGSDRYLWGEGLLIWHIDESFTDMFPGVNRVNSLESCFGVNLMQADGAGHLYKDTEDDPNVNYGDEGDPFPGSSGNMRFTVATNPSSSSYEYDRDADGMIDVGYASEVAITDIVEDPSGLISCTVTSPSDTGFQIGYDEGGYTGYYTPYPEGEGYENRAGILVRPKKSSYLRNIRTVFMNDPSEGPDDTYYGQVFNYTIRVWEGLNHATRVPIHEQSGAVDWTASAAPRKYGGWATIPLDVEIFCGSDSEYYIEIQYIGTGRTMPYASSAYTDMPASGNSFIRWAGSVACEPWPYGDWNIRAVFEERTTPVSADPVGWWKLDGDTLDSSGLGNHGTAVGNPTFASGKSGSNALYLDGNDYVVIDGVADDITNNDITLCGWVKTTNNNAFWLSSNGAPGGNVNKALMGIRNGKAVIYDGASGAYEGYSNTSVSDNFWHMLTYIRSGSTGRIYVDGEQESTHTADWAFDPTDRWSIGQEWDDIAAGNFLTGTVDDVRVYDRALTTVELERLIGTAADFIVVDDFEAYNDLAPTDPRSNRIFDTWMDGWSDPGTNGAFVGNINPPYAETTIVHAGSQSMPYMYDNALVGKSEATMTLVDPRDWTEQGVGVLSLWFQGVPSNAAEQMYVAVANSNGATAAVSHDDPGAARIDMWTEWLIDLKQFADRGVDLTAVDKLTIGFGNRENPRRGGVGKMYFDDIRLYGSSP